MGNKGKGVSDRYNNGYGVRWEIEDEGEKEEQRCTAEIGRPKQIERWKQ